ncbi:MAG: trimeric intracellular cation channel family protein [Gaiellaceae bacterium]
MLHALDLIGTFAFALSGALLAVRKRMDIFGVVVLAVASGLGGGIIRDVLIGATPPVAITHWGYLATAAAAGLVGFAAPAAVTRARRMVLVFDAVGLGLFAVSSTAKALEHGVPAVGAVVIGVITAVGGGVARDLLAGDVPVILHSDIYATPAAVAGIIVATVSRSPSVELGAAILATGIRLAALRFRWSAPKPRT